MKLQSARARALQGAGGARWQPRIRGRDPDMRGVVGRDPGSARVAGQNPDTRGVVGRLLDMQGIVGRHFAIFWAPSVRISPEVPRTVRNAPGNATLSESRPTIPALSESCPRPPRCPDLARKRCGAATPQRRLRTAGTDPPAALPQPDHSAAKSSSPSHRHPRSRCAGCPLPCNRPPNRRSCLSAQSAQDCIQPN